jgi:hypothetical protein
MAFDSDLRTLIKTMKKVSKPPFNELKRRPDWNLPSSVDARAEQPDAHYATTDQSNDAGS